MQSDGWVRNCDRYCHALTLHFLTLLTPDLPDAAAAATDDAAAAAATATLNS